MASFAQKFGYINTQELFALMPELKSVEARLDSLNSQYESLLTAMQEEYQKKYNEKHKKQILEKQKEWRRNNPEKVKAYNQKYWEKKAREMTTNDE